VRNLVQALVLDTESQKKRWKGRNENIRNYNEMMINAVTYFLSSATFTGRFNPSINPKQFKRRGYFA